MRETDDETDQKDKKKRRKPSAIPYNVYVETTGRKVALHYQEIIRFGANYAEARLRQPRSRHGANLSDLRPGNGNGADIAVEAFTKLLSGERQDWDGNPETLRQAVGSCINSILSGRLKRHDNVLMTSLDDQKLDWLYSDIRREDDDLLPAEEHADRHYKVRIIRRLLPAKGYDVEAEVLNAMIMNRAFNAELIEELTELTREQVSNAFVRLASYLQTEEFAIRLDEVLGERVESPVLAEIKERAADIVRIRFKRKLEN